MTSHLVLSWSNMICSIYSLWIRFSNSVMNTKNVKNNLSSWKDLHRVDFASQKCFMLNSEVQTKSIKRIVVNSSLVVLKLTLTRRESEFEKRERNLRLKVRKRCENDTSRDMRATRVREDGLETSDVFARTLTIVKRQIFSQYENDWCVLRLLHFLKFLHLLPLSRSSSFKWQNKYVFPWA